MEQPLYEHYGITIDCTVFGNRNSVDTELSIASMDIESWDVSEAPESKLIQALKRIALAHNPWLAQLAIKAPLRLIRPTFIVSVHILRSRAKDHIDRLKLRAILRLFNCDV